MLEDLARADGGLAAEVEHETGGGQARRDRPAGARELDIVVF